MTGCWSKGPDASRDGWLNFWCCCVGGVRSIPPWEGHCEFGEFFWGREEFEIGRTLNVDSELSMKVLKYRGKFVREFIYTQIVIRRINQSQTQKNYVKNLKREKPMCREREFTKLERLQWVLNALLQVQSSEVRSHTKEEEISLVDELSHGLRYLRLWISLRS